MRRTARYGVLCAAVALATTGCSVAVLPPSGPVAIYPEPDYGMDALLTGTLRLHDRCVVVESEQGSNAVPVFPTDVAIWNEKTDTLTWKGDSYSDGDSISLGGGYVGTEGVANGYFPDACADLEVFLVSPF